MARLYLPASISPNNLWIEHFEDEDQSYLLRRELFNRKIIEIDITYGVNLLPTPKRLSQLQSLEVIGVAHLNMDQLDDRAFNLKWVSFGEAVKLLDRF